MGTISLNVLTRSRERTPGQSRFLRGLGKQNVCEPRGLVGGEIDRIPADTRNPRGLYEAHKKRRIRLG